MRIAYVCADPGIPVHGQKGASIHVRSVIHALRERGAHVTLFAARREGKPAWELQDVPALSLPRPQYTDLAARETALLAANHDLSAVLAAAGSFDMIYERYSLWSYAGMEYARRCGIPGLLEVNAPLIDEQARHRGLIHRAHAEAVARCAFRNASSLLAVSQAVADYLEPWVSQPERVHVVPNGVDPTRFAPRVMDSANQCFTVGFVGTLKPWHGLDVLLDAFALFRQQVPHARLLLVGDGPEREAIVAQAEALGVRSALHLTGSVPATEIPALLSKMDIATAPYPADDTCYFSPLKLFEYMAAGRAIAASAVGQCADVIEHEHTGLLCQPGDAPALAAALLRLQRDTALRLRLGDAARNTVLQHHTWSAVAGRILELAGEPQMVL
jgi:glycosyltransferase involved in cell wall biosynthesis